MKQFLINMFKLLIMTVCVSPLIFGIANWFLVFFDKPIYTTTNEHPFVEAIGVLLGAAFVSLVLTCVTWVLARTFINTANMTPNIINDIPEQPFANQDIESNKNINNIETEEFPTEDPNNKS